MALTIISLPDQLAHVGNEIFIELRTSLALTTPNLRIRVNLVVNYNGSPVTVQLAARKPLANGRVRFHLHDHLKDFFRNEDDIPPVGGTSAVQCQELVRSYFLQAYEISGTVPAITDVLSGPPMSGLFYAIHGGIAKQRWLEKPYFTDTGWWKSYTPFPFYEWPQREKVRTGRTQDQWVYFYFGHLYPDMIGMGIPDFYLNVRITWDDLTTLTFDTATFSGVPYMWMIPTGFTQLGIPALETANNKKCLQYRVRLAYMPGTIYGCERTYVVDHQYYEWQQEVQYRDGLGAYVQLLLRGRPAHVTDVNREVHGQYHQYQQPKYYGDTVDTVVVLNGKVQASGGLDALEMRKMQELLASPRVLVKDAQLGWVPAKVSVRKGTNDPLNTARVVELEWQTDRMDTVVDMIG